MGNHRAHGVLLTAPRVKRIAAGVLAVGLAAALAQGASASAAYAAAPLQCDQRTIYALGSNGDMQAVDVKTHALTGVTSMAPGTNALAISVNGTTAFAFDGPNNRLARWDSSTGTVTPYTAIDPGGPANIIRGAVNPIARGNPGSELYYYATGTDSRGVSVLHAFDPATNTSLGEVGEITGLPSSNGNGDIAFSASGVMFITVGDEVRRVDGTVPAASGTTTLGTTLVTAMPNGTASTGIAFTTDGFIYLSSASRIIEVDPSSGAQVASFSLTTASGSSFSASDLASCTYANTLEARANVVERVAPGDQFGLSVTGGGLVPGAGNTATTSGSTTGLQDAIAGPALGTGTPTGAGAGSRTYTYTESAAGTADLSHYDTTWTCVDTIGNTPHGSDTGTTATVSAAPATGPDSTDIVCTFTNTPKRANLRIQTTLGGARVAPGDQFVAAVHGGGAAGTVQNSTGASTTAGTGSTVTAGTGDTGSTSIVAYRQYTLTDLLTAGSPSADGQYGAVVTCTDANGQQSGLPNGDPFTGALAITPAAHADITCVVSETAKPASLSVQAALSSSRFADGDQFTVAMHTGGASGPVVNVTGSSTTAGTGATVTSGTGTTGITTGTGGTTYTITQDVSANASYYTSLLTCQDPSGYTHGLPNGVTFTGSATITPAAGSAISCTISDGTTPPGLSLHVTGPGSMTVGVPATYDLTVHNGGGSAGGTTVRNRLPANISYTGTAGTGWTCTPSGTVSVGQTVDCTGPAVAAGSGTSSFSIQVTPVQAAGGTTVVDRAIVDTTGGTTPGSPTGCTADGTPTAGCTATAGVLVANGIDLSLDLQAPATITAGAPSDWTLTVTNSGTGAAGSATVSQRIPAGFTYAGVSGSGATCSASGSLLNCSVPGPIGAGNGTVVFAVSLVADPAGAGRSFIEQAAVDPTGGTSPVSPSTCTAPGAPDRGCAVATATTIGSGTSLGLALAAPAHPEVGVSSAWTMTVTNTGTGDASGATVSNRLPDGIDYVSASGASCSAAGQVVTCTIPTTIAAGASTVISLLATPQPSAGGTTVTDRAAVDPTGGSQPPTAADCTDTDRPAGGCAVASARLVATGIDLRLAIEPPAALSANLPADYRLTVTNTGTGPSGDATVTTVLDAGLAIQGATGATCTQSGQVLTCTVSGTIDPGADTTFTVRVVPDTSLRGTAVTARGAVDPDAGSAPGDPATCSGTDAPRNGCAIAANRVVRTGPNLTVGVAMPPVLTVGVPAEVRLTVANGGTDPAASATVTTLLPAGVQFTSASGGTCARSGQRVTCTVPGPIASGADAEVTLTLATTAEAVGAPADVRVAVDPTGGARPIDPARCTAAGAPDGGCRFATAAVDPGIALTIALAGPADYTVGVPATFRVTVTDTGTGPASGASVLDRLPEGFRFESASGASCAPRSRVLACAVPGTIAPGASVTFNVVATPLAAASGTDAIDRATVDTAGGALPADPATCTTLSTPAAGCAVTVSRTVAAGVLLIVHQEDPPALVAEVPADYTLTVANIGTGDATSATVVDRIPDGTEYVSASGAQCTAAGRLVTCTVPGPIEANGGAVTFSVTVRPTGPAAGRTVSNIAIVDGTGGTTPGDPATCGPAVRQCTSATTQRVGTSVLHLVLTGRPSHRPTHAGDRVAYRFRLTNAGQATLDHLVVQDPRFAAVRCPVSTLNPGASTTCTAPAHTVTQAEADAGVVVNRASATARTVGCTAPCRIVTSNPSEVRTPVTGTPAIAAAETVRLIDRNGDGTASPGETLVYTVRVRNTGTVTIEGLRLRGTAAALTCAARILKPGATTLCTGTHLVTAADARAGSVRDVSVAYGSQGTRVDVVSARTTVTSPAGTTRVALAETGFAAGPVLALSGLLLLAGVVLQLTGRLRGRRP